MMLTLTRDELQALTGFAQAAKQRKWLDERGVPYRNEGRLLVSRAVAERWLSGSDVVVSPAPDWAAVR